MIVGFNPQYLIDMLKNISAESVELELPGRTRLVSFVWVIICILSCRCGFKRSKIMENRKDLLDRAKFGMGSFEQWDFDFYENS